MKKQSDHIYFHIWICLQPTIASVIKTRAVKAARLLFLFLCPLGNLCLFLRFLVMFCLLVLSPATTFPPPELQQPPRSARPSAAEFTKPWRPSPWCTTWRQCTSQTAWRTRQRPSSIMKTRAESTRHPAQMRYSALNIPRNIQTTVPNSVFRK